MANGTMRRNQGNNTATTTKNNNNRGMIRRIPLSEHNTNSFNNTFYNNDDGFHGSDDQGFHPEIHKFDDNDHGDDNDDTSSFSHRRQTSNGMGGTAGRIPRNPASNTTKSKRNFTAVAVPLAPPASALNLPSPSSLSSRKVRSSGQGAVATRRAL